MSNLIFKRTGEMIGICHNAETIEILQYNVDGKGGFLFIGESKSGYYKGRRIGIESADALKTILYSGHYRWDERNYKIDNLFKEERE